MTCSFPVIMKTCSLKECKHAEYMQVTCRVDTYCNSSVITHSNTDASFNLVSVQLEPISRVQLS